MIKHDDGGVKLLEKDTNNNCCATILLTFSRRTSDS